MERFFSCDVKKVKEFLQGVIACAPAGALLSFEGEMSNALSPHLVVSMEAEGHLLRNVTETAAYDFWIFCLNPETKAYLAKDFVHRVGIIKNVLHILLEVEGKLIFSSHDTFSKDCVFLRETEYFSKSFLESLHNKKILWSFKVAEE